jgi:hypothetical protein
MGIVHDADYPNPRELAATDLQWTNIANLGCKSVPALPPDHNDGLDGD